MSDEEKFTPRQGQRLTIEQLRAIAVIRGVDVQEAQRRARPVVRTFMGAIRNG